MAEETDTETVLKELQRLGLSEEADVLLLQEVMHSPKESNSISISLARALGWSVVSAPGDLLEGGRTRGLAILSRRSLWAPQVIRLKRYTLGFKSRCRIALGVTLDAPFGALRVFNLHLDSRINTDQRIQQLKPVMEDASSFDGPKVIGGDFNTMNVFWIFQAWPLPYLQRPRRPCET